MIVDNDDDDDDDDDDSDDGGAGHDRGDGKTSGGDPLTAEPPPQAQNVPKSL